MRPVAIIPAPQGRAAPDLTRLAIGFLGASCAFGAPALIVWCIRLNGWV